MAAMADIATPAAAVTAGYAKIQIDRTATTYVGNKFCTIFEKWLTGEPGLGGFMKRSSGEGSSAAAADTAALASLNSYRGNRYGKGTLQNAGQLPGNSGFQHTPDVT